MTIHTMVCITVSACFSGKEEYGTTLELDIFISVGGALCELARRAGLFKKTKTITGGINYVHKC